MTDDPYPSMRALTDKMVGVFIAALTITLPLCVICNFTKREDIVKINNNVTFLSNDNNNQRVWTKQHVGQGASHVHQ